MKTASSRAFVERRMGDANGRDATGNATRGASSPSSTSSPRRPAVSTYALLFLLVLLVGVFLAPVVSGGWFGSFSRADVITRYRGAMHRQAVKVGESEAVTRLKEKPDEDPPERDVQKPSASVNVDDLHDHKRKEHNRDEASKTASTSRNLAAHEPTRTTLAEHESDELHWSLEVQDLLRQSVQAGFVTMLQTSALLIVATHLDIAAHKSLVLASCTLLATSVAAGFSEYVVRSAEREFLIHEWNLEREEVLQTGDEERQEMIALYQKRGGLRLEDASTVADTLSRYPEYWVRHMLNEEIGLRIPSSLAVLRPKTNAARQQGSISREEAEEDLIPEQQGVATAAFTVSFMHFCFGILPVLGNAYLVYSRQVHLRIKFFVVNNIGVLAAAIGAGVLLGSLVGARHLRLFVVAITSAAAATLLFALLCMHLGKVALGIVVVSRNRLGEDEDGHDDARIVSGSVMPSSSSSTATGGKLQILLPTLAIAASSFGFALFLGSNQEQTFFAQEALFDFLSGSSKMPTVPSSGTTTKDTASTSGVSVLHVFIISTCCCLCAGLGCVPFFFVPSSGVTAKTVARANLVAAGIMLAASWGLITEAFDLQRGSTTPPGSRLAASASVSWGFGLGILFIVFLERYLGDPDPWEVMLSLFRLRREEEAISHGSANEAGGVENHTERIANEADIQKPTEEKISPKSQRLPPSQVLAGSSPSSCSSSSPCPKSSGFSSPKKPPSGFSSPNKTSASSPNKASSTVFPSSSPSKGVLLFLAMFFHSFAEGVAIGVSFGEQEGNLGLFIAIALAVHNVPEGLVVGLTLLCRENDELFDENDELETEQLPLDAALEESSGTSSSNKNINIESRITTTTSRRTCWQAIVVAIVSSMPQPFMAVVSLVAVQTAALLLPYGLSFAAGAMVYVSYVELWSDARKPESGLSLGEALIVTSASFLSMCILQENLF
ncbi:unnamed protein product [Amoebophrya sp. A25]|nr:unnamed protein product [Amoebophrya sp. A25]|eukprot:GSA25T00018244001.1